MSVHNSAMRSLDYLFYEFNLNLRRDIYDAIERNRLATIEQNSVIRPELQANIKYLGSLIEDARLRGNMNQVEYLIELIQAENRKRHSNREKVKLLAEEQAVNKAMLAEVSRAISGYEDMADYDTEMHLIFESLGR